MNVPQMDLVVLACQKVWEQDSTEMLLPPEVSMTAEESAAFSTTYTNITTLVEEMTVKFIMGTESMDGYDAFAASLSQYGLEDCLKIKQDSYNRFLNR